MSCKKTEYADVDWIRLAQDKGQCQAVGNMVMKFRFYEWLSFFNQLSDD
jgi:hypothetical protein